MIISNSFSQYSKEDLAAFQKFVYEMRLDLEKVANLLENKKTVPKTNNVIFINPNIISEHKTLENVQIPIHEVMAIYYEWHKELLALVTKNTEYLSNTAMLQHIENVIAKCKTFNVLFKDVK